MSAVEPAPDRRPARHLEGVGPAGPAGALAATHDWAGRYDHLREVTRDDLTEHLDGLDGHARRLATTALRSLFGWAKQTKLIFANPAARIRYPPKSTALWQPLRPEQLAASLAAADTLHARFCVALAAVHGARPGQIRALQMDDVDLTHRRITIAGHPRPLDQLTLHALLDWLTHRRERWPVTANPHLLINYATAVHHGPVSHTWVLNLRGLPGTLEQLRIDRQLDEALAAGGDPLHLAAVFNLSDTTAIRYAVNARELLAPPDGTRHETRSGSAETRVPTWHDDR